MTFFARTGPVGPISTTLRRLGPLPKARSLSVVGRRPKLATSTVKRPPSVGDPGGKGAGCGGRRKAPPPRKRGAFKAPAREAFEKNGLTFTRENQHTMLGEG